MLNFLKSLNLSQWVLLSVIPILGLELADIITVSSSVYLFIPIWAIVLKLEEMSRKLDD